MLNKGLFLACALALLSACDSSTSDKAATTSAPTAAAPAAKARPVKDVAVLKQRYAGRELSVVDVSECSSTGPAPCQ